MSIAQRLLASFEAQLEAHLLDFVAKSLMMGKDDFRTPWEIPLAFHNKFRDILLEVGFTSVAIVQEKDYWEVKVTGNPFGPGNPRHEINRTVWLIRWELLTEFSKVADQLKNNQIKIQLKRLLPPLVAESVKAKLLNDGFLSASIEGTVLTLGLPREYHPERAVAMID